MQCQAELLFGRNDFGSRSDTSDRFTKDHRSLAAIYQRTFLPPLYNWKEPTLTQLCYRFTRTIYEYLLNDDQLPFSSIFSPNQAYSHPKADVCIYMRPTATFIGYIDVQVGNITYVLNYIGGMCP